MAIKYVRDRAGKRHQNHRTAHLYQSDAKRIALTRSTRLVMISSLVLIAAFMILDKALQEKPNTPTAANNASAILVSKTAQQKTADSEEIHSLELKLTSGILADRTCKVEVSADDYEKVQRGDAVQVTFHQNAETGEIDVLALSFPPRTTATTD